MKIKKIEDILHIHLGLKYKLFASYIFIIIIPVLIGTFFPYTYTEKILVSEINESVRFSLEQIVSSIKYKMVKYNNIVNKLVNDDAIDSYLNGDFTGRVDEANLEARNIYVKKFVEEIRNNDEEIINIKIYKKNDTIPTYSDYILDEKNYSNEDWFKGAYGNKGVSYWKDGSIKSFNDVEIKTISLIKKISQSDSEGLLEIELRQDRIFDRIYNFNYKKDSFIGIINQQGKIIAQNDCKNIDMNTLFPHFKNSIMNTNDASFTQIVGDESYLLLNEELNFQAWRVVVIIPISELYGSTKVIKLVSLLTALSCIFVFLLITVLLSDFFTSRLQKLTKRMRSVENGNFNVSMTVKGNDEISELSRVFNSMVESIRNLIEEVYKGKIEKKEAELRALQEQINPHFLYNTLSSINWMAIQAKAPKIVDIVESLATFYRLSLSKGRETIPLKDEITQAKAYVSIQKIRYEDSFEVHFEVEPDIEEAPVIKLIIQPFLENAIIHGFSEDIKGSIFVTVKGLKDGNISISIVDNGKGMDEAKVRSLFMENEDISVSLKKGSGYGIRNVNERIKLHYGEEFGVNISSKPGCGTDVEIKLPFRGQNKGED